jgi:hypothetical protein
MSLLLCVAAIGQAIRSFWYDDQIQIDFDRGDGRTSFVYLGTCQGLAFVDINYWVEASSPVFHVEVDSELEPAPAIDTQPLIQFILGDVHRVAGFGYVVDRSTGWMTVHKFAVPLWFFAGVFAAMPGFNIVSYLKTKRAVRLGLCFHCGYDLRATPDRCPECGTIPPKMEKCGDGVEPEEKPPIAESTFA